MEVFLDQSIITMCQTAIRPSLNLMFSPALISGVHLLMSSLGGCGQPFSILTGWGQLRNVHVVSRLGGWAEICKDQREHMLKINPGL
jgi:hypothetical protein